MLEAVNEAGRMLWELDDQLLACVRVSMECSLAAMACAMLIGVPLAVLLGRRRFFGRQTLLLIAHTGMAVPTVVVGLLFYGLLSRSGPLGPLELDLLYTKPAIVLGEFALAFPIVVALFSSSSGALDPALEKTARTLGAGRVRVFLTVLREAKSGLVAASMAAFGRIISELGIAMMLGGNIKGATRTMTTAIALETQKGEFALGLALGLVLLLTALGINTVAQVIRMPTRKGYADLL